LCVLLGEYLLGSDWDFVCFLQVSTYDTNTCLVAFCEFFTTRQ
jgi:hypothetical protein